MSAGRVRIPHRQPTKATPLSFVLSALAAGSLVVSSGTAAVAASPDATEQPDALVVTPSQPEGPFYPVELPVDRDADLTLVAGADGPAAGEPLLLVGQLLTVDGGPVEGAVIEIWQTDDGGVYLHPQDPEIAARDSAFQGYGQSLTDEAGAWSFRTILPEIYGGRPRHIHAKIKIAGETALTTQIYFSGGDIPGEGTVPITDDVTDALTVEAFADLDADGNAVLRASHLIVIPVPAGG